MKSEEYVLKFRAIESLLAEIEKGFEEDGYIPNFNKERNAWLNSEFRKQLVNVTSELEDLEELLADKDPKFLSSL